MINFRIEQDTLELDGAVTERLGDIMVAATSRLDAINRIEAAFKNEKRFVCGEYSGQHIFVNYREFFIIIYLA
jgi:hypothetical protein